MDISKGTVKDVAQAVKEINPANALPKAAQDVDYAPMDLPFLKLAVPELPGYYMYWHLGKNVPRALKSGYTFVEADEVELVNSGIANDRTADGSTDLGSRLSVSAGASGAEDEERLYLMKIPLAIHERHMVMKTNRNEEIAVQLRAGMMGAEGDPDRNKRYMKEGQTLFYPKGAKR